MQERRSHDLQVAWWDVLTCHELCIVAKCANCRNCSNCATPICTAWEQLLLKRWKWLSGKKVVEEWISAINRAIKKTRELQFRLENVLEDDVHLMVQLFNQFQETGRLKSLKLHHRQRMAHYSSRCIDAEKMQCLSLLMSIQEKARADTGCYMHSKFLCVRKSQISREISKQRIKGKKHKGKRPIFCSCFVIWLMQYIMCHCSALPICIGRFLLCQF